MKPKIEIKIEKMYPQKTVVLMYGIMRMPVMMTDFLWLRLDLELMEL